MNAVRLQEVMDASKNALQAVHPLVASRTTTLIKYLAYNDLYFGAFMGLRTIAEQDALYAQGRTTPGKVVTNAKGGQSWHNFGLAVDLVEDGDANKAGVQWSWANATDFLKIGDYAQKVGLSWGGFWKSLKDYPHVELTADLSLSDANLLYRNGGLDLVWKHVTEFYGG